MLSLSVVLGAACWFYSIVSKAYWQIDFAVADASIKAFGDGLGGEYERLAALVGDAGAKDYMNSRLAGLCAQRGDFGAAKAFLEKVGLPINRDYAMACVAAYEYLAAKTPAAMLKFIQEPLQMYGRALANGIVYAETKNKRYFDASVDFAKLLGEGEKRALAMSLSAVFVARDMPLENSDYWELVYPDKYFFDVFADIRLLVSHDNLSDYARSRIGWPRIRYFLPPYDDYKKGATDAKTALERMDDRFEHYKTRAAHVMVLTMKDIALLYYEIGGKEKAEAFVGELTGSDFGDPMMSHPVYVELKNCYSAFVYAYAGNMPAALALVEKGHLEEDRVECAASVIRALAAKKDFNGAAETAGYFNSFAFRMRLNFCVIYR